MVTNHSSDVNNQELRINLHGKALKVQNGSMQWARLHTMIGLNDRQLFEKLILVFPKSSC